MGRKWRFERWGKVYCNACTYNTALDYLKKQGGQLAEQEVSRIVSQIVEGNVLNVSFIQSHTPRRDISNTCPLIYLLLF